MELTWRELLQADWFPEKEIYTPVEPVLPFGIPGTLNEQDIDLEAVADPSLIFYQVAKNQF